MPFTSYSELKTTLATWLNRSDLTAVVPDFIALFEAEANRTVRVDAQVQRTVISTNQQYTQLPTDYRQMLNIQLNVTAPIDLEYLNPEQADVYRKLYAPTAGQPLKYTLIADGIELIPTPDDSYELEIAYYQKVTPLSDSNTSNWLLVRHPDLYLYGSLAHSAPFLREDERVALWVAARDQILESIRMENERAMFSGSTPQQTLEAIG